jgi:SAM-dependent methyltransferase
MGGKSPLVRLLYRARDFQSRALFDAILRHGAGEVLDVGGWDFFESIKRKGAKYASWTSLENDPARLLKLDDPAFRLVYGDGCALGFRDASFDTVLCLQVLEHVFEPIRMVDEIGRVLKPGGKAVFLIPQTSTTHLAPHYHQNLSRYWIARALPRAGLEIVEHHPLGGVWSSMASRLIYFFLQAARVPGMSDAAIRRGPLFYLLFPLMALYALVSIPICLVLGLGDLKEEPNNHLVVARRVVGAANAEDPVA